MMKQTLFSSPKTRIFLPPTLKWTLKIQERTGRAAICIIKAIFFSNSVHVHATHIRPLNKLSPVYGWEPSAIKPKSCSSRAAERRQQMRKLDRGWGKGTLALINTFINPHHCHIAQFVWMLPEWRHRSSLHVCVSLFVLFNLSSQLTQKSQMRDGERDVAWLRSAWLHSSRQFDSQKYHKHGREYRENTSKV